MTLTHLTVHQFRKFKTFSLDLDAKVQLICGTNGSGKTSLLEAIYFSCYGKSFRGCKNPNLAHFDTTHYQVSTAHTIDDMTYITKYHHQLNKPLNITLNDEKTSISAIAKARPCLLLDTNTHRLISQQAKSRRAILDFCGYYLYPDYPDLLSKYQRTLDQRNKWLKSLSFQSFDQDQFHAWTEQLAIHGERITRYRQQITTALNKQLNPILTDCNQLQSFDLRMHFAPNWDTNEDLNQNIIASKNKDIERKFTHIGPHRDDFLIHDHHQNNAFDFLSQGQLKRLAYALKMAQLQIIEDQTSLPMLVLIDDLSAELDHSGQMMIYKHLLKKNTQTIITSIEANDQHPLDPGSIKTLT